MGIWLTATTIHLSLLSYLLAVVCWVTKRRGRRYRWFWTLGCGMLWAHVVCAFHFYHHWSHASAVAETADQTEALLGFRFGLGIWFNYALLAMWTFDVLWEWWDTRRRGKAHWFTVGVHLFAFFIIFNGTVVFKAGTVRWAGIVGAIWVARMAWRYRGTVVDQGDMVKAVHD